MQKLLLSTLALALLSVLSLSLPQAVTAQTARHAGKHASSESFDLKQVKLLEAYVQINAGTLTFTSGPGAGFKADFSYSRESWKPTVTYTQEAGHGQFSIRQPEEKNTNMDKNDQNHWELQLGQHVPTKLRLRMGAGEGTVDLQGARLHEMELEAGAGEFTVNLSNTSVAELKVNAGVGKLSLDLTGSRTGNLEADINGGIGDVMLLIPRKTGVRVKVNGLGSIHAAGLRQQGGYYVNEAYGKTPYRLDIEVNGGLGSVTLKEK